MDKNVLKLASLYVCTLVGAGFATGRELFVYFMRFGVYGFFGVLLSALLFALFIYMVLMTKSVLNSRLLKYAVFVFNMSVFAAMLAAVREILPFGDVATAVLVCFAVTGGLTVVSDLSAFIMPFMISAMLICCAFVGGKMPVEVDFNAEFLPYALMYTAYNIITPAVIFDKVQTDRRTADKTAVLSFIIILMAMISLSVVIYFNYDEVKSCALPIYKLTKNSPLGFIYSAVFLCAVFTTALSSCKAMCEMVNKPIVCTALAFAFGLLGFERLIDKVYFCFGILGIIIAVSVAKTGKKC